MQNLILILNYLVNKVKIPSSNIYCICDPALQYYIDNKQAFLVLLRNKTISIAPKVADEFILLLAEEFEFSCIISNDKYREYLNQLPSKQWLKIRKISFMIIKDQIYLSPDIDYGMLDLILDEKSKNKNKTTIEVLEEIEKTEGELNFY